MARAGNGAAWGALLTGLGSAVALPLAVYVTRFSEAYELLHAGFVIPVAVVLAAASLTLARRVRIQSALSLSAGGRKTGLARVGRVLAFVGLYAAAVGVVSLGVYGLLEYVGSRD